MDSNKQPCFSNEQGREFQTFGSSSHSRKISIGILMDSFTERRPKDVTIQPEENATPSRASGKNMHGVLHTSELNQLKPVERETSPWLPSRSFHEKLSISEQVYSPKPAPILLATTPISEVHNRVHAAKDETTVGVEEVPFASQKCLPEEHQTNKTETRGSETLRMKLWEILGTISSPKKQHADEHDINMEAKSMNLLQNNDEECVPVAKLRQNSDTIETDSECLDLMVGRPATRSLTRRKAAVKLKASKMENAQSTYYKKDNKEENNSLFKEEFSRSLHYAFSGGSLTFMRKRSKRWRPGITSRIKCSHELENPGQNQSVKSRGKRSPSHEKSLLHANGGKDNGKLHQRKESDCIKPKGVAPEIDSHKVHVKDVPEYPRDIVNSPKLQQNVNPADQKLDNPSPIFGVKIPKERYIPDYPANEMEKPSEESSPGSPPKTKLGQSDGDSPAKMISNKTEIQSFKIFLASRSNYVKSDFEPNSSGYTGRLENSPIVKPNLSVEEEPESGLSLSSSEDSDLETSKDGFGKSKLIFPEIPTFEKPAVGDSSKLRQQLDLNEGDELASAVSLFALALERVKSKMKSMVRKRSAEILISVAEAIQLQLQTAETQIQADMAKLTSTNKSKRKRLHMRFEELQGELNAIYERFKDEANRHLQDCRYTVEGLDAHQMELKGTLEKQSVSHRKLLFQAEEAIEAQLKDAQRRIAEVHNLARKKMFQLKDVMADCF